MNKRGKPIRARITQQLGAQPDVLFERALEESGFWLHLEGIRRSLKRHRDRFRIIIKPDMDFYDPSVPGGTSPQLVEQLIDLLEDRGFREIVVGDGRNEDDSWLYNRDPLFVPELAGYRFRTGKGHTYEVVDLQSKMAMPPSPVPDDVTPLSKWWSDADYRINFAKNKTHEEFGYALCVHNLAGIAAAADAEGRPRRRIAADDCLEVLRRAPPHFNLIDAFVSAHGAAGHRAPQTNSTHAFLASADALLVDWAGAAKMGLDPFVSPVNGPSLRHIGLPISHEIDGNLAPYPMWRNVHPLISHSARIRNRSEGLGRFAAAWYQSVDREHFPFRDFYSDRINSFVSPMLARLDENPRSFWTAVLLNYAIARFGSVIVAQYTMAAKNKLRRRTAPLQLDPGAFDRAQFEQIPGFLQPYERLLEDIPANKAGLRWRQVDGAVLFSCSHVFPIPFAKFVGRVDIARSIQFMNDYVGGSANVLRSDGRGRVVHQAERNLYLPQPNWMVLFGGDVIDVEKIELIERHEGRQVISWRTVGSPNDSASNDDGSVSFVRADARSTAVTIFARQKFSVPLLLQVFDINLAPGIRDPIIESGYSNFFAGTIANIQAVYEGRDFRIGRDADEAALPERVDIGALARYLATAVAAAVEVLRHRSDVVDFGDWLFGPKVSPSATGVAMEVDRDGFRHFAAVPADALSTGGRDTEHTAVAGLAALVRDSPDFVNGLADAIRKDLNRVANSASVRPPS